MTPFRSMSRRIVFAMLSLMLFACTQPARKIAPLPAPISQPSLALIPLPHSVVRQGGEFVLHDGASIRAASAAASDAAHYFTDLVRKNPGISLHVAETPAADIEFVIDPTAPEGDEAYVLDVAPARVQARARTSAGLFYAGVTLWQLASAEPVRDGRVALPALRIDDAPRFGWRGFMLDSARHFQTVDEIKTLLDAMAQLKLNVFHWHLTDDQGWRLQIKRYAKLTDIGAWRIPAGAAGRDANGQPRRYGGFYTQDDVRDIVSYAGARHIRVVPEIEMPGHAQAAIAAYPELGAAGTRPPVSPDWGVNPYLYNVEESTFIFLQNVLDEVMALFPGEYIHVGGDEAIKNQWRASKRVQQRMRELDVKDENALQGWFTARIEQYLAAHGRRLIGWDEILEGGVPPRAAVMSWRGTQGTIDAARLGHDVVAAPSNLVYLNRFQSDAHDEPPGHDYLTILETVYNFEPVPAALDSASARHVIGAQAELWTEHVRTFARVEHMVFPRLDAFAESVWTEKSQRNWHDFLVRLVPQLVRYRAQDIAVADSAFAVRIDAMDIGAGNVRATLSNQAQFGDIRYTLDGSEPSVAAARYQAPLELKMPVTLRAASFAGNVPLAAARTRVLDAEALRTRYSEQLVACGDYSGLRLEDDAPLNGLRAVLQVNIMNPCWIWPKADLTGIAALRVSVANLPFNFQLGDDVKKIKLWPPATPEGELVVLLDRCDGERVASLSLAPARGNDALTELEGTLRVVGGTHDLCFHFTGESFDPLWAINWVRLEPTTGVHRTPR